MFNAGALQRETSCAMQLSVNTGLVCRPSQQLKTWNWDKVVTIFTSMVPFPPLPRPLQEGRRQAGVDERTDR